MRNANALYRGERPRLHYKTKSNVQFAWRCCGGGVAGEDLWAGRERGWGRAETPETGSRDDAHSGEQCRPRRTRSGGNSRGWRHREAVRKVIPLDAQGRVVRGVTSTHTTTQTLPAPAICRGRSPPATKVAGDYWRLGETAHLPEVSLFERFLSRARGVRPNRSTRTRRGLARRGGPTYSVAVLFGTFGGAPIWIYTTGGDNLPPTLSARGYGRERGCPI